MDRWLPFFYSIFTFFGSKTKVGFGSLTFHADWLLTTFHDGLFVHATDTFAAGWV